MDKKNKFVFNIGFNQANPDHVKAVYILNNLGHGKADYISKAIRHYEEYKELPSGSIQPITYKILEEIIKKIMSEQKQSEFSLSFSPLEEDSGSESESLPESDLFNIMDAISTFRMK